MSFWRRTRMISFRVSEQEFELLRSQSEAEGARSVSDYARITLCGRRNGAGGPAPQDLNQLKDEIEKATAAAAPQEAVATKPALFAAIGGGLRNLWRTLFGAGGRRA